MAHNSVENCDQNPYYYTRQLFGNWLLSEPHIPLLNQKKLLLSKLHINPNDELLIVLKDSALKFLDRSIPQCNFFYV